MQFEIGDLYVKLLRTTGIYFIFILYQFVLVGTDQSQNITRWIFDT